MALCIAVLYFGFLLPVSRARCENRAATCRYLGLGGVLLGLAGVLLTAVRAVQQTVFLPHALQFGFALVSSASLLVLGGSLLAPLHLKPMDLKRVSIHWSLGISFLFLVLTLAMDLVASVVV
jgi:hypothetical protein